MTANAQRELVLAELARRAQIAEQTAAQMKEAPTRDEIDPLAAVDPQVRAAAEDEYYAAQGKRRYRTSDGRTMFLTPEEIALRRRGRTSGKPKPRGGAYGPGTDERSRRLLSWGFNIGAVLLALVIVMIILS